MDRANTPALTLADGTVIMADGRPQRAAIVAERVMNGAEAKQVIARMRLTLADLPTDAKQANPLMSIITYSLVGMSPADIAFAFGVELEQLERIKASSMYKQLEEMVVENIYQGERENARALISGASTKAARKMVEALDGDFGFSAAKDILDRSGVVDGARSNEKRGRSLSIVVTDGDESPRKIELEVSL